MGMKKRRTLGLEKHITADAKSPPVGPFLDFRRTSDDAWYSVNLVLQGDTLIVMYKELSADQDEEFHAGDLRNLSELSEFQQRFRPVSDQLEASDCGMVEKGNKLCVFHVFGENQCLYHDAIVEEIIREEHTMVDGREKCSCSFVISWTHGPKDGSLSEARIEDLCSIESNANIDPRLACFMEIVKWKHGLASPSDQQCPISSKSKPPGLIQKSASAMDIGSGLSNNNEGNLGDERDGDVDLGGQDRAHKNVIENNGHRIVSDGREYLKVNLFEKKDRLVGDASFIDLTSDNEEINVARREAHGFIIVENLEKDISPSTIVNFVRNTISLEIEAFVLLSSSSEPYARGALGAKSVEESERLFNFVFKPDQMITSLKGRPWIVSDFLTRLELGKLSFWCVQPDLKNQKQRSPVDDELKVVHLGSPEYSKAAVLRDLFVEFTKHLKELYGRLALEENNILDT